jgi:hypothetical protein
MYFIPSHYRNIVSLGQLDENGCKITIEGQRYVHPREAVQDPRMHKIARTRCWTWCSCTSRHR